MKKLLIGLVVFSIAAVIGINPISAQEKAPVKQDKNEAKQDKDQNQVKQKKNVLKQDEKAGADKKEAQPVENEIKEEIIKKSNVYTIGEIVIREKAIANVEEAAMTTVLTSKDLKSRSEKTLDQALETIPGMIVKQGQKGQMNFDMRGFQHNTVALLVDGLPFEEIYDGGGGDISRINVMNASEIIVNRGTSSALYGSRGAFGSINVITKKPDRLTLQGSTEFDNLGGFTINASGGAVYKDFYFLLSASMIKNNGFDVSSQLGHNKRVEWMNKLIPWYMYGYTPQATILNPTSLEYILDNGKWNHLESNKYYAMGKAGYSVTKNIEIGISANYYQGESLFNGFELGNYSSYNLNGTWSNPSANNMFQNRAWEWPKDYRINVAPYITTEFGDFFMRAIYYYTKQANVLKGWTNQAESAMFDGGKVSEHDEESNGFYIYPTYKFASWNKLNAVAHYRLDVYDAYKKRLAPYAPSSPNYYTPWFKTVEMSAKYITAALEDEFKFKTDGGDVKFSLGVSYDAQKLSREFGGRMGYFGAPVNGWREDITGKLRPRQKPNSTADVWGTGDSFDPVFAFVYEPIKEMLKLRGTLSKKVKFPTLHQYNDTSDYIDTYFTTAGQAQYLPLVYKLNQIKPETSYNGNTGFELNLLEKALTVRGDYFYAFYKNMIMSVKDPNAAVNNLSRYTNIKGREVHGAEGTLGSTVEKDKLKVLDMNISLTYVFTHARDWYDPPTVLGDKVINVPTHQVIMLFKWDFISGTGINLWTNSTFNQIIYMQKWPTSILGSPSLYSTKIFMTKRIHNPFKLDIRISQRIVDHFDLWVMCKNILDDYNADPFNPGAGRTWYFGADAEF
jgi:outer membrane receptor protein involved in Fe transport